MAGYVYIQEGGTSTELYLHVHDTMQEAENGRASCAKAAYRTTAIVTMPDDTDWGAVEGLVQTLHTLDYHGDIDG